MFEHHFGLRENPFPAGHLLKFVYPSREHQEARAHLRYGIENREPFLLITGEVGTGKTTSLYDALNEWGDRVAVALITNSSLTRQEMLEEICLRFGLPVQPGVSKPALLVMLERHLIAVRGRGEHAVLMMDEAQNLSMDLLEEIRLLSNLEHRGEKLLQIFLVGQPELEAHLARHELRQLRQRITVHYRLNPLSPDETLGYIHHHINVAGGAGAVVFPSDTCREIYRLTHGIPREINTLASSALIAAYADSSPNVRVDHITAVAQEGDFRSVLSGPGTRPTEPTSAPPAPAASPPPVAAMPAAPPPPIAAMPAPPPPPTPMPPPRVSPAEPAVASWPPLPQMRIEPPREVPIPPPPHRSERESFEERERGEISKGLLAAMRRAEVPVPPPPPVRRQAFATSPQPTAVPAPVPLPIRPAPDSRTPKPHGVSTMPSRFRDRIERELANEDGMTPVLRHWLIAVSVLATLGIMLILMQRFGAIDVPILRGAAGTQATRDGAGDPEGSLLSPVSTDPTAALIDSLKREVETAKRGNDVQPASSASPPARPRTTSTPASNGTAAPVRASNGAAATQAPPTGPPTNPESSNGGGTHFGVGVASYLDMARATTESDRLAKETTLTSVVMPYRDAGTTMYRVVIGRWPTVADAEQTANSLMERGVINEARVVTIPKR